MGVSIKEIQGHEEASKKLAKDVQRNNVKFYDIESFKNKYSFINYPEEYLEKCANVTVAISGSYDANWMLVAPYRVDIVKGTDQKVYDLDPMIINLDSNNDIVFPTAYIRYHGDFGNRGVDINGV